MALIKYNQANGLRKPSKCIYEIKYKYIAAKLYLFSGIFR